MHTLMFAKLCCQLYSVEERVHFLMITMFHPQGFLLFKMGEKKNLFETVLINDFLLFQKTMDFEVKQFEKIHWKKRCLKDADSQNESTLSSSSSSITPPTSPTSTTPTSPKPASPLATSQTPTSPLPRSFHEFTHHPGGPFAYPLPTSNGLKRRSPSPIFINHPPKRPTVVLHPAFNNYQNIPQLIPNTQHFSSQPCFPNFFNPHNNPFLFPSLHFNSLACGLPPHHGTTLLPHLPPQPLPQPPPQTYLIPNLPDLTIERTNSRASSPRPSTSSYSSMNSPRSLTSPHSNYQQVIF